MFKKYFYGALHNTKDRFRAMANDIAELTTGYPAYQLGNFKLCHEGDLPFLLKHAWVTGMVQETRYPKHFKKSELALSWRLTPVWE